MKNTMKQINLYMLPKKYLYIYVCVYNWLNKKQKTILKIFAKKIENYNKWPIIENLYKK